MKRILLIGIVLSLAIAACAAPSDSGGDSTNVSVPDTRLSPIQEAVEPQDAAPAETLPTVAPDNSGDTTVADQSPTIEPGDNDPNLAGLVATASADLAERLSVTLGDIVVISAESVVWPDGSLGCPIPDMRYTQVQVEGALIVLSVDGGIYNYHSGANRGPFLCVPTKAAPGITGLTLPGNPGLDE
jgi:hypothetical protein